MLIDGETYFGKCTPYQRPEVRIEFMVPAIHCSVCFVSVEAVMSLRCGTGLNFSQAFLGFVSSRSMEIDISQPHPPEQRPQHLDRTLWSFNQSYIIAEHIMMKNYQCLKSALYLRTTIRPNFIFNRQIPTFVLSFDCFKIVFMGGESKSIFSFENCNNSHFWKCLKNSFRDWVYNGFVDWNYSFMTASRNLPYDTLRQFINIKRKRKQRWKWITISWIFII